MAIPARFLPYGKYKMILRVTMLNRNTSTPFTSEAFTFIDITESPLVPQLVEGGMSLISIGIGQSLTLNPGLYSTDPDVDPSQNQVYFNRLYLK